MKVFLLLGIRNLIQHSSGAAYDGRRSPENLLGPFFFSFRLVFYSSFGLKHCMVPRDLAFRAWEKLSITPGILVSVWRQLCFGFLSPTTITTSSCSYGFLPLGTVDNFCWRRTGLEAQMI
jgi:hypothetical protein